MPYILALDQGTTSSRAIIFDHNAANMHGGLESDGLEELGADDSADQRAHDRNPRVAPV